MSGRHEPLADALRRHQQPIVAEPDADVAVVGRGVAARVHPAADFDDVGAQRRLRCVMPVARAIRVAARGRAEVHLLAAVRQASRRAPARRTCRRPDRAPSARRSPAVPRARRCAAGDPLDDAVDHAPEGAGDQNRAGSGAGRPRTIRHLASAPRRRARMRGLQPVERALGRLAFGAVGRELQRPAARPARRRRDPACRTPSRCRCSAAS